MKLYAISPLFLQKLIWIPTRLTLAIFGHITVSGVDNLKSVSGNAIFACNHTSELDPILIPASLSFWSRFSPMFYTSRESKFYKNSGWRKHFYGGWFFKLWGSYPVFVGLNDYAQSLRHHIGIVNAGGSVCVFPEGGITRDGKIQPAKGGVAYLAHTTRVPVVPVRIDGAYGLSAKDFFLGKAKISVSFGKPVSATALGEGPSLEQYKAFANEIMILVESMKMEEYPILQHNV